MNWLTVLNLILQLFGPLMVEWLRKLLESTAKEMPYNPSEYVEEFEFDLSEMFYFARERLWWFQFRKRAALRIVEQITHRHADRIRLVAKGYEIAPPTLTQAEASVLYDALS